MNHTRGGRCICYRSFVLSQAGEHFFPPSSKLWFRSRWFALPRCAINWVLHPGFSLSLLHCASDWVRAVGVGKERVLPAMLAGSRVCARSQSFSACIHRIVEFLLALYVQVSLAMRWGPWTLAASTRFLFRCGRSSRAQIVKDWLHPVKQFIVFISGKESYIFSHRYDRAWNKNFFIDFFPIKSLRYFGSRPLPPLIDEILFFENNSPCWISFVRYKDRLYLI